VEECGFGAGSEGYVKMQAIMQEHQTDPLINQYIGTAMRNVLAQAGLLDLEMMKKAAAAAQAGDKK
jgi:hypothetical protein